MKTLSENTEKSSRKLTISGITVTFLSAILPIDGDLFVELRALDTEGRMKKPVFYPCTLAGFERLAAQAWKLRDTHNLFVGVHPRMRKSGKAVNVAGFYSIFCDCDTGKGKPHHDKDAVLDRLAYCLESGKTPELSLLTDSGGGFHPYYRLDEMIPNTPEGIARYQRTYLALNQAWNGNDAGIKGDDVSDPARIMRLPGSLNHKAIYDEPVDVTIESKSDAVYSLDDLPCLDAHVEPVDLPDLPTELAGFALVVTKAMRNAGVFLRPRKTIPKPGAKPGINALVLDAFCPACMTPAQNAQTPGRAAKGHVRISPITMRMKCFHGTCGLKDNGLPIHEWMPRYYPDAWLEVKPAWEDWRRKQNDWLEKSESTHFEQPESGPLPESLYGLPEKQISLDEAQIELERAFNAWQSDKSTRLHIIDTSAGAGKSWYAVNRAVAMAKDGQTVIFACQRHDLIEEFIKQGRASDPEARFVHVKGWQQCEAHGAKMATWRKALKWNAHELCLNCHMDENCDVLRGRDCLKAKKPGVYFCTHQRAEYTEKQLRGAKVIYDEMPELLPVSSLSLDDVLAVKRGSFMPNLSDGANWQNELWYQKRHNAAVLIEKWIVRAGSQLGNPDYSTRIFGEKLLNQLTSAKIQALIKALAYDRKAGNCPAEKIAAIVDGTEPELGYHVRQDFDDFSDALLSFLSGNRRINVAVSKDPDGGLAIEIKTSATIDDGALILAAGGSLYPCEIEATSTERAAPVVTNIRVNEPDYIERTGTKTGAYSRRNLSTEKRIEGVIRKLLHGDNLIPQIWQFANDGRKVKIGFMGAKKLIDELRKENNQVFDLFRAVGWEWDFLHFGAIDGSRAFEGCNVIVQLGDDRHNLSMAAFDADTLRRILGPSAPAYEKIVERDLIVQAYQNESRGRAIRATEKLLLMRYARGLDGYKNKGKNLGSSSTFAGLLTRQVAREILAENGWISTPFFDAVLSGDAGRQSIYSGNCTHTRGLVNYKHLAELIESTQKYEIFNEVVSAAGATKIQAIANGKRGRPVAVYETRPGAYLESLQANDPELAEVISLAEVRRGLLRDLRPRPKVKCGVFLRDVYPVSSLPVQRQTGARSQYAIARKPLLPASMSALQAVALVACLPIEPEPEPESTPELMESEIVPVSMPEICDESKGHSDTLIHADTPKKKPRIDYSCLLRLARTKWPELCEWVQERAAIREFDGEQSRSESERGALHDLCYKLRTVPGLAGIHWPDFSAFELQGLWQYQGFA